MKTLAEANAKPLPLLCSGVWSDDILDQIRQTDSSGVHAQTDGARQAAAAVQGLPGQGAAASRHPEHELNQ